MRYYKTKTITQDPDTPSSIPLSDDPNAISFERKIQARVGVEACETRYAGGFVVSDDWWWRQYLRDILRGWYKSTKWPKDGLKDIVARSGRHTRGITVYIQVRNGYSACDSFSRVSNMSITSLTRPRVSTSVLVESKVTMFLSSGRTANTLSVVILPKN